MNKKHFNLVHKKAEKVCLQLSTYLRVLIFENVIIK